MNRKLHNSLMAVVSSSALLVVGLLAAVPAQQSLLPHPMSVVVIALSKLSRTYRAFFARGSPRSSSDLRRIRLTVENATSTVAK